MSAYPFEQHHQHFASGVNHPGEVEGLFDSGRWVGITAGEARSGLIELLEERGNWGTMSALFVDSGAFGEMDFGAEGPKVNRKRELTPAKWENVFALYELMAAAFRTRCYVVAPDRIGDQVHSLKLLTTYAPRVAVIASMRAQIIVPVQKGALSMGDYFTQAQEILGLRERREDDMGFWVDGVIAGIPMKKDATSLAELAAFVDTLPMEGARIHLLGMGPESKRYAKAIEIITSRRPSCLITSDSVTIRRLCGRTNGRKGGPRALTKAQDEARARGLTASRDIKHAGLMTQGVASLREEVLKAYALGWSDPELDGYRPGLDPDPDEPAAAADVAA